MIMAVLKKAASNLALSSLRCALQMWVISFLSFNVAT